MAETVYYTRDVKLAAALTALGFKPRNPNPMERIVKNGEPFCMIYFENDPGISDYMKAWSSPTDTFDESKAGHPLNDSNHHFWYMRAALRNRDRLVDASKKSLLIHIKEAKGKIYILTFPPK